MTKSKAVNQSQLSGILGVTLETIRQWRRLGCPFTSTGTRVLFVVEDVKRWRAQRDAKLSDPTIDALKIRKLDLQNRLRQIQLDLASGKVIDRAAAVTEMQTAVVNCKTKMQAWGTKLAPLCLGCSQAEIQEIIDAAAYDVLLELAETPSSLAGASPRR